MLPLRETGWRLYGISILFLITAYNLQLSQNKNHLKVSTWINSFVYSPLFLWPSFSLIAPVSCTQQHFRWIISMAHQKSGEKRTPITDYNWVFVTCQNGSKHFIYNNYFNLYNDPWGFYNLHFINEKNQALRNSRTCSRSHSSDKIPNLGVPKFPWPLFFVELIKSEGSIIKKQYFQMYVLITIGVAFSVLIGFCRYLPGTTQQ